LVLRRRRRTTAFGLLILAAACIAPVATAHADAKLTVSPLIIDLEAGAGDVLTEPITVTASGSEPITVELVHADFGFGDDYGVVLIRDDAPETTAFSTREWFSLPKEQYRIPAGQTRQLPLRIEVPKNTPGGTYLGAALIRVVPDPDSSNGSQVQAVPEAGPLLFIAVEGGDPPSPRIKSFDVPRLVSSGPIRPKVVVTNDGDEYFALEGTLKLSEAGKRGTFDVRRQYVVPGEPRELSDDDSGSGEAKRPSLGQSKLGIGKHEITARLRIDPTGKTLVATRTVWVIPTWLRVLVALGAVLLVIGVVLLVRRIMDRRAADPTLDSVDPARPEADAIEAEDATEAEEAIEQDLLQDDASVDEVGHEPERDDELDDESLDPDTGHDEDSLDEFR
jgi:hypothetical protein